MNNSIKFPYAAIAAQSEFKLAIELLMVDKSIGGLLVLGDKGTGKTTTVRSLSQLMKTIEPDFSFVNLPIGASEDRVLGAVDLEKLINDKKQVLQKGLLAQAHQGILYIDEVNLLNDYLTDILLDAAATGGYHLEREGLSVWQDSKFCLIGTMNPEEGELRPQLLDRFGLCVEVSTPRDLAIRKTITQRRIEFDLVPEKVLEEWSDEQQEIRLRLQEASKMLHTIDIPESIFEYVSSLCIQHQVEGLRADILLVKAGRAYAALSGETILSIQHIDIVAPFVLKHRSKNQSPSSKNSNENNTGGGKDGYSNGSDKGGNDRSAEKQLGALPADKALKFFKKNAIDTVAKGKAIEARAFKIQQPATNIAARRINIFDTVKHYTARGNFKIVYTPDNSKTKLEVYFLVDSSGSMAKDDQIRYTKGLISYTLKSNRGKQISFIGIALCKGEAEIFQPGTTDGEEFIHALEHFPAGGQTNLTAGFKKVYYHVRQNIAAKSIQRQLYIFTDGKLNCAMSSSQDPFVEAVDFYKRYLKSLHYTKVVNTERGFVQLRKARELADKLHVKYAEINP